MAQGKLEKRCSSRLCRCVLSLAGGTTVRYADEGFFDMAGFPREYLETSCGGSLKTASPQLYGQICAMREQPDNPGRGEAEFRYQRADGTELWLYLNGGLAELEGERRLECLFLDVTELVVARTRLENITNTIPGGVVQLSFGEDWRILYANDGFYRLNGYTRQEYRALAGDLFIRLMHPDDEAVFETAVREMIGTRQTGVADYRVRQKDGSWRWRVAYGKMIGSTEEGVPVIQCVILDNEEKRQLEQKLELENERYQAVAQMSDGVLWEYNAAEDEAIVPYSVRSVLVDQMRTPGFSDSAYAQGTVHPEDLPRLEQFRRELREGKPHILFEFRARQPGDGEYRWHRAEGVTLCGADGRPARTVGRTADIDREKRERLRLRDAAERDPMTGLYNRSVVQRLIDERFEQDPPVRAGSLFVVDIDNFKAVNDRLGHLFGDVLLTNIAKAMRETVRPGDILGRIGGDEFVVFLPGASRAEGERIAGELVARVSRIYAGEFTDLQITASVGVADCPRCGDHYVELFRKADRALYRAKRHGKDRAEAYEPDGRGADGEESLLNLYEMDRPEVRWQDGEMESMLDLFPRILSSSKDIDSAIYLMLDRIGEYCRAADVGILERTPKGDRLQATYLGKRGTGRVPISSEEAFSFSQWPGYLQRFEEGVYTEPDGAMLPGCVRPDRRCALLQCGIYDEGAFSGCVVVCDRGGRHDWTRQEIALTLGFARAVTPYILKRRTAAEAQYRLDRALNFDELTGLLSLGSFKERAAAYLAASPRSRCAIIYSDIVNFKYINDAYGFTTGDEVLRDFARAITERGGAVCSARLGNDSFISLTRYESLDQLEKHISRIDQEFNAGVREKLPGSNVMVASGVCPLSLTQGDLVEAIDNANIARKSIKGFHKGGLRDLRGGDEAPPLRRGADGQPDGVRAGKPGVRRLSPAQGGPAGRADGRRGGAGALAAAGREHHPARRVHPLLRTQRLRHPHRPLRARPGARADERVEGRGQAAGAAVGQHLPHPRGQPQPGGKDPRAHPAVGDRARDDRVRAHRDRPLPERGAGALPAGKADGDGLRRVDRRFRRGVFLPQRAALHPGEHPQARQGLFAGPGLQRAQPHAGAAYDLDGGRPQLPGHLRGGRDGAGRRVPARGGLRHGAGLLFRQADADR